MKKMRGWVRGVMAGAAVAGLLAAFSAPALGLMAPARGMVVLDQPAGGGVFPLAREGRAAAIYVAGEDSETVRAAAGAFAGDVESVAGAKPEMVSAEAAVRQPYVVIVGTVGHSPLLDRLRREGKIRTGAIEGKWESAVTTVVDHPFAGVRQALVIAGSDRRGAAFALFTHLAADGGVAVDVVGRCAGAEGGVGGHSRGDVCAGRAFGEVSRHLLQR